MEDSLIKKAIETKNVWRIYKEGTKQEVAALKGVNLSVDTGQFVVLKGRSGSGKTTLLNLIGGLDYPSKGEIFVFGSSLSELSDKEITIWRRKRIGFIFQSFGLTPTFSAFENVELLLRIAGVERRRRYERANYCLNLVGLGDRKKHRPDELSGGQQQRVAIARALANQPSLILADEPTGDLDSSTAKEIFRIFRQIVDVERVTCFIATHDSLVDDYADLILELRDGQIGNQI